MDPSRSAPLSLCRITAEGLHRASGRTKRRRKWRLFELVLSVDIFLHLNPPFAPLPFFSLIGWIGGVVLSLLRLSRPSRLPLLQPGHNRAPLPSTVCVDACRRRRKEDGKVPVLSIAYPSRNASLLFFSGCISRPPYSVPPNSYSDSMCGAIHLPFRVDRLRDRGRLELPFLCYARRSITAIDRASDREIGLAYLSPLIPHCGIVAVQLSAGTSSVLLR